MSTGFEARIAEGLEAARSASSETLRLIATSGAELSETWTRATRAAEALGGKEAAIRRVADDYAGKLRSFAAAHPRCAPPVDAAPERLPADGAVRRSASGWAVADDVVARLRKDLHDAESEARNASGRAFSGRPREAARASAERAQRLVAALQREAKALSEAHTRTLAERDAEAREHRAAADRALRALSARTADALRGLPPALTRWDAPSWRSWSPLLTHSEVLLGFLRAQRGQVPGPHHDFAWDIQVPQFVSTRGALRLRHSQAGRERALGVTRSLLLRSLASTPAGKLRLSIFDPVGLGESAAALLELGEYDRDLIGGKAWSSTDDLRRVLAEHTAHIELVIQKYLRAEYATLEEFNAAAGEIAEPYRLLVLFDGPTGFDEQSVRDLVRMLENGPRCGVGTLLVTNDDVPAPYGASLERLPASLRTIQLDGPVAASGLRFDLVPLTDADAPRDVVSAIVSKVGAAAQRSILSAVPFDRTFDLFSRAAMEGRKRGLPRLAAPVVAADPATWWAQTTVASVAAPIGLRGARDVATLTLDSSNHAGALLVGRPGSGKSTLLHTFIAGITAMYGPEELELHLIDFKEGVEFKVYAAGALPHARTVAIESDREFGVSVLQAIQTELAWRGALLRGSAESHSSLETLRNATGERLPRIVLIFDEFQVLFARNDKLGGVAAEVLEVLIRQGRGFGIHVVLGSQSLAGLDALGSHVPQLLPVRILLPAADGDAFKVLGEGNAEGTQLTSAGEGILNPSGGAVEANERFRGAVIGEEDRRGRVAAMRAKADASGFRRRPIVFEGNAQIPAEDTLPARFADEVRGGGARTLRLRFGAPMAIAGSADIDLRRESGANVLLVARDAAPEAGAFDVLSLPRAVTANITLSAVARRASVEVVDFLPIDEGLETLFAPLLEASAITLSRRRQVSALLERVQVEVQRRVDEDDTSSRTILLVLYGMHRARDFDQDSVDYDAGTDLPERLRQVLRDGPEFGVHTFMWFDTVAGINRRLPSSAIREVSWRLAGRMSIDDSASFVGVDAAGSLREQQVLAANEDRGVLQRCTTIAEPPPHWIRELLATLPSEPKEAIE